MFVSPFGVMFRELRDFWVFVNKPKNFCCIAVAESVEDISVPKIILHKQAHITYNNIDNFCCDAS